MQKPAFPSSGGQKCLYLFNHILNHGVSYRLKWRSPNIADNWSFGDVWHNTYLNPQTTCEVVQWLQTVSIKYRWKQIFITLTLLKYSGSSRSSHLYTTTMFRKSTSRSWTTASEYWNTQVAHCPGKCFNCQDRKKLEGPFHVNLVNHQPRIQGQQDWKRMACSGRLVIWYDSAS